VLDPRAQQRVLREADRGIAAEQQTGERHAQGKDIVGGLSPAARGRRRHRRLDRQESGGQMHERRRADAFPEHRLLARRANHDVGGVDGAVNDARHR
jgi:hypothetical protein